MQFGLMVQNEDSVAQTHRDMHQVTIMKRAEMTQKMIEMKMSLYVGEDGQWGGGVNYKIYESIENLFAQSEDLQMQLQKIGSQKHVSNPIVLNVLSNVATSMGLSNAKMSGNCWRKALVLITSPAFVR